MFPAQDKARLAHEAERQIPEFDVYELPGGRWQAIHRADRALVISHTEWTELFMVATTVRIRREVQKAAVELAERIGDDACNGHPRISQSATGGGINA